MKQVSLLTNKWIWKLGKACVIYDVKMFSLPLIRGNISSNMTFARSLQSFPMKFKKLWFRFLAVYIKKNFSFCRFSALRCLFWEVISRKRNIFTKLCDFCTAGTPGSDTVGMADTVTHCSQEKTSTGRIVFFTQTKMAKSLPSLLIFLLSVSGCV